MGIKTEFNTYLPFGCIGSPATFVLMTISTWIFMTGYALTVEAQEHRMIRKSYPKDGEISQAHHTIPSIGIQVGRTTLKEVRAKLGKSGMPRGTGGKDEVCYISGSPADHTLVRFRTHDWVGRDLLAEVEIMADQKGFPKSNRCGKSPLITKDLMTASGLKLGLTKAQATDILGPDSHDTGEYIAVDYAMDKKGPPPNYTPKISRKITCYYLFTSADARFANGQAASVNLSMVEEGGCGE